MRHKESEMQIKCVRWFRATYPKLARLLFSVPNGGARRRVEGAILKAEGVMAGVSDLVLLFPSCRHHGLCIEMKTAKGYQRSSQKAWQADVEWAGYKYVICRSVDDFVKEIRSYLKPECPF